MSSFVCIEPVSRKTVSALRVFLRHIVLSISLQLYVSIVSHLSLSLSSLFSSSLSFGLCLPFFLSTWLSLPRFFSLMLRRCEFNLP